MAVRRGHSVRLSCGWCVYCNAYCSTYWRQGWNEMFVLHIKTISEIEFRTIAQSNLAYGLATGKIKLNMENVI